MTYDEPNIRPPADHPDQWGLMKALAAGVLGKDDQAEIIVLADKLHAWAAATRAAA